MPNLTTQQMNAVLVYALREVLRMNRMDAHLFTDLGMEHYRGAVDRVELLEAALKDVEQSDKMVHRFLCPYCHGPLAGVIAVKERGK